MINQVIIREPDPVSNAYYNEPQDGELYELPEHKKAETMKRIHIINNNSVEPNEPENHEDNLSLRNIGEFFRLFGNYNC